LIEQIRTEIDSAKRHVLYQRFQEIIYDEQPAIFVFSPQEKAILNKRFELPNIVKKPGYVEGRMKLKR
jgi:peptide/nickel transport system substrate-binding protein